jgi:C4-dicarboxylate-specific signal transduction histidine kinase
MLVDQAFLDDLRNKYARKGGVIAFCIVCFALFGVIGSLFISYKEYDDFYNKALVICILISFGGVMLLSAYAIFQIVIPVMKRIDEIQIHQKKLVDEINESQQMIKASSKFVSLGEQFISINHDMNNIVTMINMFVITFKRNLEDQPELAKKFTKLEKATDRLMALTTALRRSILGSNENDIENFKLIEVIKDCEVILTDKFKRINSSLKVDMDPNLSIVMRKDALYQVLLNLIGNSLDAQDEKEGAWVKVEVLEENEFIFVNIIDSGSGLPEEVKEKLFTPFFTTKKAGSGIGLTSMKKNLEELGGDLYYDESCKNTCFTIKIPKALEIKELKSA